MKKLINQRFITAVNFLISEKIEEKKGNIAEKLDLTSSKLSEILNERMNTPVEVLSAISKIYGFSVDWLLNNEGDMLKTKSEEKKSVAKISRMPSVITVDEKGNENIIHVPVKAQAGYLESYDKPVFLEKLPTYNFPNLTNGTFRMFDVEGFSMIPTLPPESKVIGQFVENWITDIKDDRLYIVVSNDGVVVKRCLNRIEKYGNLFCKSDNRKEYPNYPINIEDIKEVWEVKIACVFDLPNPADLFDRINDLEAKMMQIETNFKL